MEQEIRKAEDEINQLINEKKIVMFTKAECPFCKKAKRLIEENKDRLEATENNTAIIELNNIEEIDNTINEILPNRRYRKSKENLKEFSYQQGKILNFTNCLDARLLEKNLFIQQS